MTTLLLLASASPAQSPHSAIDRRALDELLAAAKASHSDAVVVWSHGKQVGSWYFGKAPKKIEAMSVTKSIVNLAVGRLVTQGRIASIDEPVYKYFPEWRQGRKEQVTLRHLLNHTSGLQANPTTEEIYRSPDFVRLALAAELSEPPGTRFFYNNKAVNLLAGVVERASGKRMDRYLGEELFTALGITDFGWTLDSAGNPHAMAGLQILPGDLAKLGQLVLDRGRWGGQQLIAERWFEESLRPGSKLSPISGLLWWLTPASTRYVIDDSVLSAFRAAGVDTAFVRKAESIRGTYESMAAFEPAVVRAFGDAWQNLVTPMLAPRRLTLARREYGAIVGYNANGYLGQYIAIFPESRIVAVRMVASSPSYDPKTDGFSTFLEMARKLGAR